jgi:hypothetical protein
LLEKHRLPRLSRILIETLVTIRMGPGIHVLVRIFSG